jgi:hypothetical protein
MITCSSGPDRYYAGGYFHVINIYCRFRRVLLQKRPRIPLQFFVAHRCNFWSRTAPRHGE